MERLESTHFSTQVFQIPSELLIFATTSSLLQKVAMFTSERARESPLHERWALHSFLVRIIRVLLVEELAARLAAATLIGLICKGNMWGYVGSRGANGSTEYGSEMNMRWIIPKSFLDLRWI